jgi:hypothetical protein
MSLIDAKVHGAISSMRVVMRLEEKLESDDEELCVVLNLCLCKLLARIGHSIHLLLEFGCSISMTVDTCVLLRNLLCVVRGAFACNGLCLELLDLLLCLGDVLVYVSTESSMSKTGSELTSCVFFS